MCRWRFASWFFLPIRVWDGRVPGIMPDGLGEGFTQRRGGHKVWLRSLRTASRRMLAGGWRQSVIWGASALAGPVRRRRIGDVWETRHRRSGHSWRGGFCGRHCVALGRRARRTVQVRLRAPRSRALYPRASPAPRFAEWWEMRARQAPFRFPEKHLLAHPRDLSRNRDPTSLPHPRSR